jgi:hypothetical protein
MSTHTIHEDISTHGLAAGCPRCWEHAENPTRDLDHENLRTLVMMAVDRGIRPRSEPEAVAVSNVLSIMEQFGRLAESYPEQVLEYLLRWGIEVVSFDIQA